MIAENSVPSILILKNGEKVISYLQEAYSDESEEKGICIIINYPYILNYEEDDNSGEIKIKFEKWCPFSISKNFKIPYDSVLTIGEPEKNLATAYSEKILEYLKTEQLQND